MKSPRAAPRASEKPVFSTLLVVAPALCLLALAAPPPARAQGLDTLVAEAVAAYPDLERVRAEADAFEARAEQVSQPFDPSFTFGAIGLPVTSFDPSAHPMAGLQVGVQQRFWWPGVLATRADEARALAVFRLWASAVDPYYRVVGAERAVAALDARARVLEELRGAAQARYEARAATLADVMRVEAERSRLEQQLAQLARERLVAIAELNGLLARPAEAPLDVEAEADLEEPSAPLTPAAADDWLTRALAARPELVRIAVSEQALAASERAAEASSAPTWSAGVAYSLRLQDAPVGDDLVSVTLGIDLPIFAGHRADARLAELDAQRLALDAERREVERALRAGVGMHLAALAGLAEELRTLDEVLVPALTRTWESALAQYAAGRATVETLIEIEDRLTELALARAQLTTQYDRHRAELRVLAVDSAPLREALEAAGAPTHEAIP
jgi:cobalt-zinc-cadmium efflux system outer membrane protein